MTMTTLTHARSGRDKKGASRTRFRRARFAGCRLSAYAMHKNSSITNGTLQTGAPVAAPSGTSPVNTAAPYFCGVASGLAGCSGVTGDAVVGQTLAVSEGTWTNSPTSYTYQWEDCTIRDGQPPSVSSCSPISGAASSAYTVRLSDVGKALVPIVTASTSGGRTSTSVTGACSFGSTPGGNIGTGQIYPDPIESAGCSPVSAVAAVSQTGETFCH